MNKKFRNVVLGLAGAGLLFGVAACRSDHQSEGSDAIARNDGEVALKTELELAHDWHRKNGSPCPSKEECVRDGLRFYRNAPYNTSRKTDAIHYQGTIKRNEDRHQVGR